MKEQIKNAIGSTKINVSDFYDRCQDLNAESTCPNWNGKDVLAHIGEWISFAHMKLSAIRNSLPFDETGDLDEFNKLCYEKNKNKASDEIRRILIDRLDRLSCVADQYSEDEMYSMTFPTGFDMPLWKYVMMDGFVHPNCHILYHYLKNGDIAGFIGLAISNYDFFMLYSDNDEGVFKFEEYFGSSGKCVGFFKTAVANGLNHEERQLFDRIKSVNIVAQ
jgi:hypothetical protein